MKSNVIEFFMEYKPEIIDYSDIIDNLNDIKYKLNRVTDNLMLSKIYELEDLLINKIGTLTQEMLDINEDEDEDDEY